MAARTPQIRLPPNGFRPQMKDDSLDSACAGTHLWGGLGNRGALREVV
jgi:hypothetical protein